MFRLLRPAAGPALPLQRGFAEGTDHANVQVVGIAGGGGDKVKVLHRTRQIGLRDVLQQCLRDGIDVVDHQPIGENPRALVRGPSELAVGGHGGEGIERSFGARAVVVHEEKRLLAAVVDPGDVERPAQGASEAILLVRGLDLRSSGQGIGRGVQRGIIRRVINGAVRTVEVEAAAPAAEHEGPPATATKAASAAWTATARSARTRALATWRSAALSSLPSWRSLATAVEA